MVIPIDLHFMNCKGFGAENLGWVQQEDVLSNAENICSLNQDLMFQNHF